MKSRGLWVRRRASWGAGALLVVWVVACGEGGGGPLTPGQPPPAPPPPPPTTPNRAPEPAGSIPARELTAGETASFEVSSYFRDPDGDALTYAAGSSDGSVATASASGATVTITAVAAGTATVTVTARDPRGLTATQNAAVTVQPANRAPETVDSIPARTLAPGQGDAFDVSSYFSDPDGDALTYAAASSDAAVVTAAASGATVTMTGVAPGTATVTVTARDPAGLAAEQEIGVTVTSGSNRAPEGVRQIADLTLTEGLTSTFNVLSYFTDPDGDRLSLSGRASNPDIVGVTLSGGALSITGVSAGQTTVELSARDPGNLTATMSFGVAVTKGPPMAVGEIPRDTLNVGETVTLDLSEYFRDPDGDPLTYGATAFFSRIATISVSGSVMTIEGAAEGSTSITATASDPDGNEATQRTRITVRQPNQPPVTRGEIRDRTVAPGETTSIYLGSYFDDRDALTYAAASSNEAVATVAVEDNRATVTGVARGTAEIAVTARDPAGLEAGQSFAVTVPNGAPQGQGTLPGDTLNVGDAVMVDLSSYFTDPDGDPLTYTAEPFFERVATATVSGSVMTITGRSDGSTSLRVTARDPEGLEATQRTRIRVRQPNRPPAVKDAIPDQTVAAGRSARIAMFFHFEDPDRDRLTYTAVTSDAAVATATASSSTVRVEGVARGTADVTVTARDPGGLEATQSFRVTVPNSAPEATGSIPRDSLDVGETVSVDLAPYFEDRDGDPLSYSAESLLEFRARATVSGSVMTIEGVGGGRTSVTVTARDPDGLEATQRAYFTVIQPNRSPETRDAIPDQTVDLGDTERLSMFFYFEDPDRDDLEYLTESSDPAVASVSADGRSVRITAVARGTARITIVARDPGGLEARQSFAVTVPNSGPKDTGDIPEHSLNVGETWSVDLVPYFTDADGDPLTYTADVFFDHVADATVAGGVMTVEGLEDGRTSITVTARDPEGLEATQRTRVTVIQPNRPPESTEAIPDQTLKPGDTYWFLGFGHFSDPDRDRLTYAAATSNAGVATVTVSGSRVTIEAVAEGTATVTVSATDPAGLSAEQEVGVTVEAENRAPRASGTIADQTIPAGSSVDVDVSSSFTDADGDELSYTARSSNGSIATASVSGSHVTIRAGAGGRTTVTVTARDPGGLTARQRISVTVPSRGPTGRSIPAQTITHGGTVDLNLSSYFSDPDGDRLRYTASSNDTGVATASVIGNSLRLRSVSAGATTVDVTARDPGGLTATEAVRVTVQARANRVPTGTAIPAQTLTEGGSVTLDLSSYFSDPDGDPLVYGGSSSDVGVATASVIGHSLSIRAVTPGTATVTATATDPGGLRATQTVSVSVARPDNQPPMSVGTIPDETLNADESATIQLSSYFNDPDADALTYAASVSQTRVATVSVSGSGVTVTGRARGTATVTTTARDPGGLEARQTFDVTVRNSAPEDRGTIPATAIAVNATTAIDATAYFRDRDGDPLSYTAETSDAAVATATASSSTVTISAVAAGTAVVTIIARDPGGLEARQRVDVTVRPTNRPPEVDANIPAQTLEAGSSASVDMASHFGDPDGDALAYAAATSDAAVATGAVSGSTVTFSGVAAGTATVTVTARDPSGASVDQDVRVTVERGNRTPRASGSIPGQTVEAGATVTVDVSPFFSDPDGDALSYATTSTNSTIASASRVGSTVTIAGQAPGTATVTVTASDPGGASATQAIGVTVTGRRDNRPPESEDIPVQFLAGGGTADLDMSSFFSDPDGDDLTYTATTSSAGVATASASGGTLTVTAGTRGTATVTVTAGDPGGLEAASSFSVAVSTANIGSYDLDLISVTPMTVSQAAAFRNAAEKWMRVLADTELDDMPVTAGTPTGCWDLTSDRSVDSVDDLLLVVSVREIDGRSGTLAAAGSCRYRSESKLPWMGIIEFDEADLDVIEDDGGLEEVVLHEMAHTLGFSRHYWNRLDLLANPTIVWLFHTPGEDTHFTGPLAAAAFDEAGGTNYTDGDKVPVENCRGTGSGDSHWREFYWSEELRDDGCVGGETLLGGELMSPLYNRGVPARLSEITIQSLADMGYTVDLDQAESYSLPEPGAEREYDPDQLIPYGDDVLRGPITIHDRNGRIVGLIRN